MRRIVAVMAFSSSGFRLRQFGFGGQAAFAAARHRRHIQAGTLCMASLTGATWRPDGQTVTKQ
jgi:hypothetical protein